MATATRKDSKRGRFYDIDGVELPSVTHILQAINKPALINWAANTERALVYEAAADLYEDLRRIPTPMPRAAYLSTLDSRVGKTKAHQRELAKASEIGTQVHHLIEWNLRKQLGQVVGPEPRVSEAATWALMAWQDWAQSVQLEPLRIEQTVWSKTYRYAGTLDLVARVNGLETLIDFKTSKAVYPEAHLQNVAYQVALNEMGHGDVPSGLIVRLPKLESDPAFEVQVVPDRDALFPVFRAVQVVWQWSYANDDAYWTKREQA